MRACGICRKAFRANDPGGTCTVPEDNLHGHIPGHYSACSECCVIYEPLGPARFYVSAHVPAPRVPSGEMPAVPPGLCGVCKMFAREDDTMDAMRLYPAEAPDRPELFPHAVCSDYSKGSCTRCEWQGVYEDRCPHCAWLKRRDLIEGEPGVSVRQCDWHGAFVPECPKCGQPTIQREECYLACGECRRRYAPAILERLKRDGIAPPHMRPEHMAMTMFA